jgi:CRP-like cAMP-binding protein
MHSDIAELASGRDPSHGSESSEIYESGRGKEQSGGGHSKDTYPPGAVLYQEGERCEGIFHLATGRVKLAISSRSGRAAIMKIAKPGELLAVTEAFANCPYLATAEAIEPSEVLFTSRNHLGKIWSRRDLAGQIIAQLSRDCSGMLKELRAYRLSSTTSQRLAQLLLELLDHQVKASHNGVIEMPYTHAEIAQLIGCSRETVTRLLKNFHEMKLIDIERANIYIGQEQKLREIAQV